MLQKHIFTESNVAGLQPTTGSPESMFRSVRVEADPFEAHAASLPTLDDLIEGYREEDPSFDEHYAAADEVLYQETLEVVSAGKLSRITAERIRLGITQTELAERAGMRQPNISRLEKPGTKMSVDSAKKLAQALELDDYKVLLP